MCGAALPLCLLLWIGGTTVSRTHGKVTAPANLKAEAGRPLLLACNITTAPGDTVQQVRWLNKHKKVLLAYEQSVPLRIGHQDPNVQLTTSRNDASSITIKRVRPDDEGCFRCVFDVFPSGSQEARTCVSVTALNLCGRTRRTPRGSNATSY